MKKVFFSSIFCFSIIFASGYDPADKKLYLRQDLEGARIRAKENPWRTALENLSSPILVLGAFPLEPSVVKNRPSLLEDENIEFYDQGREPYAERPLDEKMKRRWTKEDFNVFPVKRDYGAIFVDWGVWYHFVNANPQPNPFSAIFNALRDGGVVLISTEGGYFPSQHARFNILKLFNKSQNYQYNEAGREDKKNIIARILKEHGYPDMEKNMSNIPIVHIGGQNDEDKKLINEVIQDLQEEFMRAKFTEAGFNVHVVDKENVNVGYVKKILVNPLEGIPGASAEEFSSKIMIAIKPKGDASPAEGARGDESALQAEAKARQMREYEANARQMREDEAKARQMREDEELARRLQAEEEQIRADGELARRLQEE
ncbi:MAG: hypothetical protein HEEMFOPI_00969 [Holosporales bacterium]